MILGLQAMSSRLSPHDADYTYPETLSNPTAEESKMAAALGPLPLGGTPDGKAWCRKALHPADHEIMATRYPGGATVPTVSSNYTQVMELVPDPTVVGSHITSWSTRIFMRQDPVAPVSIEVTTQRDNDAATVRSFPWINRTVTDFVSRGPTQYAIPGTSVLNAAYDKFLKGKNFYRITHMGLTVEHVCSSTTNQGTVISGQYAVEPTVSTLAGWPRAVTLESSARVFGEAPPCVTYPLAEKASYANGKQFLMFQAPHVRHYLEGPMDQEMLLQATNGYTGSAKDGLYIPLKLEGPDRMVNVDKKYVLLGKDMNLGTASHVFPIREGSINKATGWPYHCLYDLDGESSEPVLIYGCKECGYAVSDTVITGLDPHASLRLYLRVGVEYIPEIDSETACFARMSPLPDEIAVRMYQEVACRMKDAFPRDYNDKSKLLEVIGGLAKRLVPAIDKGLSVMASLESPWKAAFSGARMLTQAYLAPARGKRKSKGSPASPKGGVASDSSSTRTASTVSVPLGGGEVAKVTITRPKGYKRPGGPRRK